MTDDARIAEAHEKLAALSDEALAFATEFDRQQSLATDDATFDVNQAMAFLEIAPGQLTRMGDALAALQRLVDESAAVDVGVSGAALQLRRPDCESQGGSSFWAKLRSFVSNLLGGPIPADNLYGAATDANQIRDTFKTKWQARLDACKKLGNVSERLLCEARVSQESRADFAQSASALAESGGFTVIKALGTGVVGIGVGAYAGAIGFTAGGALVLAAAAGVIAEDVIDTVFRPAPTAVDKAPMPAVIVRTRTSPAGTRVNMPSGTYEVYSRRNGSSATLRTVEVVSDATTTLPSDCGGTSPEDAGMADAGAPDSGTGCDRADHVRHPESGLCVCPPMRMDWWVDASDAMRCLPFACTDGTYDAEYNDCTCPGPIPGIPSVTEQDGMLLVTCDGF
jgi:hypothetical protein